MVLDLWEGNPPGYVKNAGGEATFQQWPETVANVSTPTIAVYLPARSESTGIALVYCSGGSYSKVSKVSDAIGDADYFVSRGVAVIVVKYRTTPPAAANFSDAVADGKRAMRLVRRRAEEWGIDPKKVGMLGGSAGANLILNVATHWDQGISDALDPVERESCRPDFIALLCPWPGDQSAADFPTNRDTPPAFVCSARDDEIAPIAFAEAIVAAWEQAGVSARLWAIDQGGHAAFESGVPAAEWKERFCGWLRSIGLMLEH